MKRTLAGAAVVSLVLTAGLSTCRSEPSVVIATKSGKEHAFRVEIADTDELRARGLMYRESMAENEGMVFIFDTPGSYPFWMKNTLIPLDMIWVDADRRVVFIAPSVPPCKADPCPNFPATPPPPALYVVEVVSGFAKKHGVKVGDQLVFNRIPVTSRRK